MAEAVFQQEGRAINYTPSGSAVAAGQILQLGGLVGVAKKDIADGALGALAIEGVFDVVKAAGAGVTFALGDTVGWDDTNNTAVTAADPNKTFDLGIAVADAADGDESVQVRINW
jgi:predicted RecA/RadA family phage recombinase